MAEFNKVEHLMILSYFRASLNQCYKHPSLTVTNIEDQSEEDFSDDVPKVDIRNAKSICKKCVGVLEVMYKEELAEKERKDDVSEMSQENQKGEPEQDQEG
jgi:hypothetical protein